MAVRQKHAKRAHKGYVYIYHRTRETVARGIVKDYRCEMVKNGCKARILDDDRMRRCLARLLVYDNVIRYLTGVAHNCHMKYA